MTFVEFFDLYKALKIYTEKVAGEIAAVHFNKYFLAQVGPDAEATDPDRDWSDSATALIGYVSIFGYQEEE